MCGHENAVKVECLIIDHAHSPQIVDCDIESGGCDKYFAVIVTPRIEWTTFYLVNESISPYVNKSKDEHIPRNFTLFYLLLDYINKRLTQIHKDKASDIIVPPNEYELRMLSEFLHVWNKKNELKQTDLTNEQI